VINPLNTINTITSVSTNFSIKVWRNNFNTSRTAMLHVSRSKKPVTAPTHSGWKSVKICPTLDLSRGVIFSNRKHIFEFWAPKYKTIIFLKKMWQFCRFSNNILYTMLENQKLCPKIEFSEKIKKISLSR